MAKNAFICAVACALSQSVSRPAHTRLEILPLIIYPFSLDTAFLIVNIPLICPHTYIHTYTRALSSFYLFIHSADTLCASRPFHCDI